MSRALWLACRMARQRGADSGQCHTQPYSALRPSFPQRAAPRCFSASTPLLSSLSSLHSRWLQPKGWLLGIPRALLQAQCTASTTPLVGFVQEMSAQQAPQTSLCKKRYGVSRKSRKPLRSDAHHGSGAGSTIVWDFIYILKFSSDVPVHLSPQEQPARAHYNTPSVQIFHHWLPSSPGTLRSEFSTLWAFTVIRLTASPLPSSLGLPPLVCPAVLFVTSAGCSSPVPISNKRGLWPLLSPQSTSVTLLCHCPLATSQVWVSLSQWSQT